MGQYHQIACIDRSETVHPYPMGAGRKMVEQLGAPAWRGAVALLLATREGGSQGDLAWSRPRGLWAGRRVLAVGDYAENGDLTPWRAAAPEKDLHDIVDGYGRPAAYTDLSGRLLPTMERALDTRFANVDPRTGRLNSDSWATDVPVQPTANGWSLRLFGETEDERRVERDYWSRMLSAVAEERYARPPLKAAGAPDAIDPTDCGAPRLWINLDREEFVDPAALDPEGRADLLGVIRSPGTEVVLASLYHHCTMGGGDLVDLPHLVIKGRWRGDRIALTGPKGARGVPGIAEVRARFADATGAFAVAATIHDMAISGDVERSATAVDLDALVVCLSDPAARDIADVRIDAVPPMIVDGREVPADLRVLSGAGGELRVSAETLRRARACLSRLAPAIDPWRRDGDRVEIVTPLVATATTGDLSAHDLIRARKTA